MRRILIAAVASSLLTGAVVAASGIAQSGDRDDADPPPTMAQALEQHEDERDRRLGRVADRLDVPAADLRKAIVKARRAELDRAVAQGRLTRAQREALEACRAAPLTCDRSNLPAPRMHRREGRGRPDFGALRREMRARRSTFLAAVAEELGKDAADVRRAFRAERPRMGRRGGPGGPGGRRGHLGPGGPGGPMLPAPGG